MKCEWTRTALREFDSTFKSFFEMSPNAAVDWRDSVGRMLEMIENHPQMGHLHRRASEGEFREVIVGRYRFIYRLAGDRMVMRRILHVRRDYDPMTIRDGYPRCPQGWPAFASPA